MRGAIVLAAACVIVLPACGASRPQSPAMLGPHMDSFTDERGEWAFAHCMLVGTAFGGYFHGMAARANLALRIGGRHLQFACPEPPPWKRDDREVVAGWLPAFDPVQCGPGGSSVEKAKVSATTEGTGPAVNASSIVRLRARLLEVDVGGKKAFHGRAPTTNEEPSATTFAPGTRAPVDEVGVVYTLPPSCMGQCLEAAIPQLRAGAKARIDCSKDSWEVELLEVGGRELFVRDLGL